MGEEDDLCARCLREELSAATGGGRERSDTDKRCLSELNRGTKRSLVILTETG